NNGPPRWSRTSTTRSTRRTISWRGNSVGRTSTIPMPISSTGTSPPCSSRGRPATSRGKRCPVRWTPWRPTGTARSSQEPTPSETVRSWPRTFSRRTDHADPPREGHFYIKVPLLPPSGGVGLLLLVPLAAALRGEHLTIRQGDRWVPTTRNVVLHDVAAVRAGFGDLPVAVAGDVGGAVPTRFDVLAHCPRTGRDGVLLDRFESFVQFVPLLLDVVGALIELVRTIVQLALTFVQL